LSDPSQKKHVKGVFKSIDKDKNGSLDKGEFRDFIQSLLMGHGEALPTTQLDNLVAEIFAATDENGDGEISFKEFMKYLQSLKNGDNPLSKIQGQVSPREGGLKRENTGGSVVHNPRDNRKSIQLTGNGIHLFLSIPSANGYSQKLVPDLPLVDLIKKYCFLLPPGSDPKRFHIFYNGLRLMDEERKISSYGVKPMGIIELKRDIEFELVDVNDNTHHFVTDILVEAAAKQLCQAIWGSKINNWSNYGYELYSSKDKCPFVLAEGDKKFVACRMGLGDEIEVKAVPKAAGGVPGTRKLKIIYSPVTARVEQQKNLVRSGWLKKQGGGSGGTKNWKERWFVLDAEKVSYYETDKKLKKPLGIIFLDLILECKVEKSLTDEEKGKYGFYIEVPGRKLLLTTKDEESFKGWLQSLNLLASLSHQEDKFLTNAERDAKREARPEGMRVDKTQLSKPQISAVITGSVIHHTHISVDWKWSGDVSVFVMEEVLGKGASGIVKRAKVRDVGFDVAIKIVQSSNQAVQEELEKEIDVLKQCKNPNIVAYYGTKIQHDQGEVWIIMDYCGAGSVKDCMVNAKENLDEDQVCYVLQGTLKGLMHLHQRKILHLDIKAANILLTDDGIVKLADFGVSEKLKSGLVESTDFVGSPLFMSPEVIRKAGYNHKTDIWSLGITTIEMVEGRPPNTDINSIEKLPQLAERDPPKFKNEKLWSKQMIDFLAHCLIKDVEKRPSAIDLLGTDPFVMPTNVKTADCLEDLIRTAAQLKKNRPQKP